MHSGEVYRQIASVPASLSVKQSMPVKAEIKQQMNQNGIQINNHQNIFTSYDPNSNYGHNTKQAQQHYHLQQVLNWNMSLGIFMNQVKEKNGSLKRDEDFKMIKQQDIDTLQKFFNNEENIFSKTMSDSNQGQQIEQILSNCTPSVNSSNLSSSQSSGRAIATKKNLHFPQNQQHLLTHQKQQILNSQFKQQQSALSVSISSNKNEVSNKNINHLAKKISNYHKTKQNAQDPQTSQFNQYPQFLSPASQVSKNLQTSSGLKEFAFLEKQRCNISQKTLQLDKSSSIQQDKIEFLNSLRGNTSSQSHQNQIHQLQQQLKQQIFQEDQNNEKNAYFRNEEKLFIPQNQQKTLEQTLLFDQLNSLIASSDALSTKQSARQEQSKQGVKPISQKGQAIVKDKNPKQTIKTNNNQNKQQFLQSSIKTKQNLNIIPQHTDSPFKINLEKSIYKQQYERGSVSSRPSKSIPNQIDLLRKESSLSDGEENKEEALKQSYSSKGSSVISPHKKQSLQTNNQPQSSNKKMQNTSNGANHGFQSKLNTLLKVQFSINQQSGQTNQTISSLLSSLSSKKFNQVSRRNPSDIANPHQFPVQLQPTSSQQQNATISYNNLTTTVPNNESKNINCTITTTTNNNQTNRSKCNNEKKDKPTNLHHHTISSPNSNNKKIETPRTIYSTQNNYDLSLNGYLNDKYSNLDTPSQSSRCYNLTSTSCTNKNSVFQPFQKQFPNLFTSSLNSQYTEGQTIPTNQSEVNNQPYLNSKHFSQNIMLKMEKLNSQINLQKANQLDEQKQRDLQKQMQFNLQSDENSQYTSQSITSNNNEPSSINMKICNNYIPQQIPEQSQYLSPPQLSNRPTSTTLTASYLQSAMKEHLNLPLQPKQLTPSINLKQNQISQPGSCTLREDYSGSRSQCHKQFQIRSFETQKVADALTYSHYKQSLNIYVDFLSNIRHPFIFKDHSRIQQNLQLNPSFKQKLITLSKSKPSSQTIQSWKGVRFFFNQLNNLKINQDLTTKLSKKINEKAEAIDENPNHSYLPVNSEQN